MSTFRIILAILAVSVLGGCEDQGPTACPNEYLPAVCGDGWCDWSEFAVCPEDCIICGDRICDDEEVDSCSEDCFECGDGVCGDGERGWCIRDCHTCSNQITYQAMVPCDDIQYCWDEAPCDVCGDGICTWIEDYTMTCPDCPSYDAECGDGDCNWWEVGVCLEDCWMVCGDRHCDERETADVCPEDCAVCGDGQCDFAPDGSFDEADYCNADCFSHGG